eukprot:3938619-Karenia_brevis.AAC.1
MDAILQNAWSKIYAGSVRDVGQLLINFFSKHALNLFSMHEFQIGDLSGEDLRQACLNANNSSPGTDGWAPADFKLLSPYIFDLLASLLNLVEEGAPWPADLLHTK